MTCSLRYIILWIENISHLHLINQNYAEAKNAFDKTNGSVRQYSSDSLFVMYPWCTMHHISHYHISPWLQRCGFMNDGIDMGWGGGLMQIVYTWMSNRNAALYHAAMRLSNFKGIRSYKLHISLLQDMVPERKVNGTNMEPFWDRQDPGGPHVGPMNFAIC